MPAARPAADMGAEIAARAKKHKDAMEKLRGQHASLRSEAQQGDKEFWRCSIKQEWQALRFAPDELRSDPELVLEAIRNSSGAALEAATVELRRDRAFVIEALHASHGAALAYASEDLQLDSWLRQLATRLKQ